MTNRSAEISPLAYARIAGFGYLIIIILGISAELVVRSRLIVPGDAATTASNIMANAMQFRFATVGDLIMLTCDVVVAWALYVLLRPVSANLALLATFFRLVHAAVYALTLLTLFLVLQLLSGADYLTAFEPNQLHAQVMLLLKGHHYGYLIALVFFGLHCLVLGYLVIKSRYLPGLLGVLLILAAFGYLIDSFANFLLPNYTDYEAIFLLIVAVPAILAELSLCLWLLVKGVNLQQWRASSQDTVAA